jgi:hypothetical protein
VHTLYFSLQHTLSVPSLLCLHQSLPGNRLQQCPLLLMSLPAFCLLMTVTDSQLPLVGSDPIQNSISNSSCIVAFVSIAAETSCHMLFSGQYHVTDDFLWLHYSGSQVSCHSILGGNLLKSVIEALEESFLVFSSFESSSLFQTITYSLENELNIFLKRILTKNVNVIISTSGVLKTSMHQTTKLLHLKPYKFAVVQKCHYSVCLNISLTATVVQWSEFLATDSEVPGSIPVATRFF